MGGTEVPCANCLSVDTLGGTFPGKSRLKNSVTITLRSALFQLYGITFPFPESADDENLILCRNCNDLLFQLHHMFNHFRDLARATSWIGAAHQDLINLKCIKTEDQDEPMPIVSSAYMVQDVACQYEDQESDDDLFGHPQFDGRPLRYLASQYNVSFDSPETPVQLKTEDVYSDAEGGTHEHGHHNGTLLENWVIPQVIFETDDSIIKTESMNLNASVASTLASDPAPLSKNRRGRPKGSKNKSTIETLMAANSIIQSSDWETRRSERNLPLKIESAYSLADDSNSPETEKRTEVLIKRRPGRPPKTSNKDPLAFAKPMEKSSAEKQDKLTNEVAGNRVVHIPGSLKRKRGRPFKNSSAPLFGVGKLNTTNTRNGSALKRYELADSIRLPRLSVTPLLSNWDTSLRSSRTSSSIKTETKATSSFSSSQKTYTNHNHSTADSKTLEGKRGPGRPRKSNISSVQDEKSDYRVFYRPISSTGKVKPKVGPGKPGPGGSMFVKPKSTEDHVHKNSTKLASLPQFKSDRDKQAKTSGPEKLRPTLSQLLHMPPSNGPGTEFHCPTCNRGFLSKVAMMTHYEYVHNANKGEVRLKKYHCSKPGCPKIFLYATSLEAHEKTHATRPSPPPPMATMATTPELSPAPIVAPNPIVRPAPPPKPQTFVPITSKPPIAPKPQIFEPIAPKPPAVPVPVVDKAQQCHICDKDFHTAANLKTHLQDFHKINVETHMDTSIMEPTTDTQIIIGK